ncbi:hypothetical protein TNCV_1513061 [Trichonephila clavipes]|nr:hypothetical protein TNCV_1513061 [Trichonephila clavipes]
MSHIKIDDNGLFKEERSLNAYLNSNKLEQLENQHIEIDKRWVLDESRSFFRVHTGYFSNIPKCIKAEFIASWACSQSSVVRAPSV